LSKPLRNRALRNARRGGLSFPDGVGSNSAASFSRDRPKERETLNAIRASIAKFAASHGCRDSMCNRSNSFRIAH
jgi:hypothetical protein